MKVNGIEELKNAVPKNYVKIFMEENGLSVGQRFKISKLWPYFYFTEDYSLEKVGDEMDMRNWLNKESILLRLLYGDIYITDRLGAIE